ncbi:MAG: DUF1987 domain-containing protein [Bacteroidales bacterium]|nr:DUF1987 domain-containing protein [Bacteroidales bacterium]
MLTKLEIRETRETPYILLDKEKNIFKIEGNSLPENANHFFLPIFKWLDKYSLSPNKETHLICDLEYFNSSSAKLIYEIFLKLEKIKTNETKVWISWFFESGDVLIEEKGLEYKSILYIPMEIVEK